MSEITLTRMRLAEGVWEGLLSVGDAAVPKLLLRHQDELVGEPETLEIADEKTGKTHWLVRFKIPLERISDGVQSFVIENAESGDALACETIVAGDVLDDDLRAEMALLRAELDLLKRAFRRHCSEG